jgi:uncharacterized protein (DUF58 family)
LLAPFAAGVAQLGIADWRSADLGGLASACAVSITSATLATALVAVGGVPLGYLLARRTPHVPRDISAARPFARREGTIACTLCRCTVAVMLHRLEIVVSRESDIDRLVLEWDLVMS